MKHWGYRIIALALLWMIFPGAMEATVDLGHVLTNGHFAHAAEDGDSHSDADPEHGCNGTFHLCSCHLTPSGLEARCGRVTDSSDAAPLLAQLAEHASSAHPHNIEHPPRP